MADIRVNLGALSQTAADLKTNKTKNNISSASVQNSASAAKNGGIITSPAIQNSLNGVDGYTADTEISSAETEAMYMNGLEQAEDISERIEKNAERLSKLPQNTGNLRPGRTSGAGTDKTSAMQKEKERQAALRKQELEKAERKKAEEKKAEAKKVQIKQAEKNKKEEKIEKEKKLQRKKTVNEVKKEAAKQAEKAAKSSSKISSEQADKKKKIIVTIDQKTGRLNVKGEENLAILHRRDEYMSSWQQEYINKNPEPSFSETGSSTGSESLEHTLWQKKFNKAKNQEEEAYYQEHADYAELKDAIESAEKKLRRIKNSK